MKRNSNSRLISGLFLIGMFLLASCDGAISNPFANTNNPDADQINSFVDSLPAWSVPVTESVDERDPDDLKGVFTEDGVTYDCTVEEKNIQDNYEDIIFAGINSDVLYPGSLMQGKGVATGQFDSVRLDRSPITLTIDLNIEEPSIVVENPTPASMRTAISELIRRVEIADIPGKISYDRSEAHSFEQSLTSIGISAGYKSVFAQVDADFNFGSSRTVNSKNIVVRFFQPMYTISFDDTPVKKPSDIFASSVRQADIDAEEATGRISSTNLPVYVKSVTYGRMLFYTLTSKDAQNYEELDLAVSAVYKSYNADAELSTRQLEILNNSQERILPFGGSQEAALASITDLNQFFVPSSATTAVPLSYVVNNLEDGSIARISDTTSFKAQICVPRPEVVKKTVTVTMDSITSTSDCDGGDFGDKNEIYGTVWAFKNKFDAIAKDLKEGQGSQLGKSQTRTFTSPVAGQAIHVDGIFWEEDVGTDTRIGDFNHEYLYPNGWRNRTETVSLSNEGCSIDFKYSIKITN